MASESLQEQYSTLETPSMAAAAEGDGVGTLVPTCVRRGKERQWSVVLSFSVATLLSLITGMTVSFSSNLILDLEQGEASPHRLTVRQQSIFAVRGVYRTRLPI